MSCHNGVLKQQRAKPEKKLAVSHLGETVGLVRAQIL